jgi:hypothetical protein
LLILVVGVLFFNLAAIASWYITQNDTTTKGTAFHNSIGYFLVVSVAISSYIVVWFLLKAPHVYKKLEEWDEDYLRSAYILIFDTTVPRGNSTGEKVLNLAKLVFPELRSDLYISLLDQPTTTAFISALFRKFSKNREKPGEQNISESIGYTVDSYYLDLALKTQHGYFIVKDFKDKVVTLEDLKQLVKIICHEFRNNVFRIICVARKYNLPLLQGELLERQMIKELASDFSIDLLVEEDIGYSVLWIS